MIIFSCPCSPMGSVILRSVSIQLGFFCDLFFLAAASLRAGTTHWIMTVDYLSTA